MLPLPPRFLHAENGGGGGGGGGGGEERVNGAPTFSLMVELTTNRPLSNPSMANPEMLVDGKQGSMGESLFR